MRGNGLRTAARLPSGTIGSTGQQFNAGEGEHPAAPFTRPALSAAVRVRPSSSGSASRCTCSFTDESSGVDSASHHRRHHVGRFRWLDGRLYRDTDASERLTAGRLKPFTELVTEITVGAYDPKLQRPGDETLFRGSARRGFSELRQTGGAPSGRAGQRGDAQRPCRVAEQSAGSAAGRPRRSAQHSNKRTNGASASAGRTTGRTMWRSSIITEGI